MGIIFDYLFAIIDFIVSHLSVIMWAAILFCGSAIIAGFVQGGKRKTSRKARTEKAPSVIERWREESERIAAEEEKSAPEEAFCDDEIAADDEEEQRIADEKALKQLRLRYDRLLDKKDRMLFCAGATDPSAPESTRGLARAKLERTKAWRGNEYDIMLTKRNIEYLERED
jgi:hypothetical protein